MDFGKRFLVYLPFLLLGIVLLGLFFASNQGILNFNQAMGENTKILTFVVTQCPYSRLFMLQNYESLERKYGEIPIYYFVVETPQGLRTIHGDEELKENLAGICIREKLGNKANWEYLKCLYTTGNYEKCIEKYRNLVDACFSSGEAYEIARKIDATLSTEYMIRGTPAVVILNEETNTSIVIEGLGAAANIEEAKKDLLANKELVTVLYVAPKDCPEAICGNPQEFERMLRNRLGINAFVKTAENAPSGVEISSYPAIVIEKRYLNTSFSKYATRFRTSGNYAYLEFGAVLNRSEVPGKIDLFIMSQCPYGTREVEEILKLMREIEGLNVSVYYIVGKTATNFTSLHGYGEVLEDLRQICIRKLASPASYWKYMECAAKNFTTISTSWESCAEEAGLEPKAVEECVNSEEAAEILTLHHNITRELGVTGSPTIIINNKYVLSGFKTAEFIKTIFCTINPTLC